MGLLLYVEDDDGGWLTDPALLDRLVDAKLAAEGNRIGTEGWKWVATAVDLPWNATNGHREIVGAELPLTEDTAVTTASAVQVREPAHTRSVGRWRRYQRQLGPALAILRSAGLITD